MTRKWRPALATVLGFALAGTLGMAFFGLIALRYLGPEVGFRNAAFFIAIVIAVLTAVLGLMLVRLLLRPMRALARYAALVRSASAEDHRPPDQFGTKELRETAAAVIEMAEALRTRETTIRSYSDHVTHELKSPVSAIVAASELLQDRPIADADRVLVDQIAGAAHQMNDELDALRRVVRAREADYRGTAQLADLLPMLEGKHPELQIAMDAVTLPMAPDGLALIFDHLFSNARLHGAAGVTVTAVGRGIDIRDDGRGIADADRARIFEPFFTTRRESGGTGMGLAIVQNILAAHGGKIIALPSQDGAHFRISFS